MRLLSVGWLALAVVSSGCTDPASPESKSSPLFATVGTAATHVQVYGSWHCSNDYCTWAAERNLTEFDNMNHWLVDRGDGHPSDGFTRIASGGRVAAVPWQQCQQWEALKPECAPSTPFIPRAPCYP